MTQWRQMHGDFEVETTHRTPSVVCVESMCEPLKDLWEREAERVRREEKETVTIPPQKIEPTERFLLDPGGIMWAKRKEYDFDIDGLKVFVPAINVADYMEMLSKLKPQDLSGTPVYNIPAMHWVLVLSQAHRDLLVSELKKIELEAAAIATAENDHFNKTLAVAPGVKAKKRPVGPMDES